MSQNVVRLPVARVRPSTEQLVSRIREMAKPGAIGRMEFDHPHFQRRMVERGLMMRQVLEVVRKGCAIGTPQLDIRGDWRVKLHRKVAGRRVKVVVAVKADRFVVVTAM